MERLLRLLATVLILTPSSLSAWGQESVPLYELGNRTKGWNATAPQSSDHYLGQIQPVLNKRCVACHGCWEAPCQTNLQSYPALRRGYNEDPIFSAERKKETFNNRMDEHRTLSHWRKQGFKPIVSHPQEGYKFNRSPTDNVLYHLLMQGQSKHHRGNFNATKLKDLQVVKEEDSRYRCIATEDQYEEHFQTGPIQTPLTRSFDNPYDVMRITDYQHDYPEGGMPFGLPSLSSQANGDRSRGENDHGLLIDWIKAGANGPSREAAKIAQTSSAPDVLARWEAFLNHDSAKARHTARYIYEHVYRSHIAFDEVSGEFYELVRTNRAGQLLHTNTPYESDGTKAKDIRYRLNKITRAIVQKNHIVWKVNDGKLTHLRQLFHDQPWPLLKTEPTYTSNNVFQNFAQIPARIRSQFMLENSHVIAGAMVQGSVCVGSRATYAIKDHFWVYFLKPDADPSVRSPMLGLNGWDDLNTAGEGSDNPLRHFRRTSSANRAYAAAWERHLRVIRPDGLSLDDIWDGTNANDGIPADTYFSGQGNPNAWITILRHGKSATVHYGPEGGLYRTEDGSLKAKLPQSIWVLSYSNFERLYYNLVAHFKEYGSLTHKLATWRHMSYVRLEAEDLAISLLPETNDIRETVRAHFTRGFGLTALKHRLYFPMHSADRPTGLTSIDTSSPIRAVTSLAGQLIAHLQDSMASHYGAISDWRGLDSTSFQTLAPLIGEAEAYGGRPFARYMPDTAYIRVKSPRGKVDVFTLIADRGYEAHNIILFEDKERDPKYDRLSVFRGTVGAYPNIFFDLEEGELEGFVEAVQSLSTKAEYESLRRQYAVHRTDSQFWLFYDELHRWKSFATLGNDPLEQGIADLSQYEFF